MTHPIAWGEPRTITGAILSDDQQWMLYPLSCCTTWWAIHYADARLATPTEQTEHPDCESARAWCEQRARELMTADTTLVES